MNCASNTRRDLGKTQVPFLLPKDRESDTMKASTKKCLNVLTGWIVE